MNSDLSVIYYTSNYLEKKNKFFADNCREQLIKAIGGLPLIIVSQEPTMFGSNTENVCVGDIGRSHLNIYRQILAGAKAAKTKFVAMAEDDILYSKEHFQPYRFIDNMNESTYYYDMAKLSIFTWYRPPIFSFRTKRRVVNQLIAPRKMLIDNLEERFARWPSFCEEQAKRLLPKKVDPDHFLKYWGDPGRYEDLLGITIRKTYEYYSWVPSIVFSHEFAFGYETNQGSRKKHGDIRIVESADWGRADKMLDVFYERRLT